MNNYAVWFGRVVWLGIITNFLLAIPSLILPGEALAFLGFPSAYPLLWVTVSALFLILLSLFYIPAALHPLRYPPVSWLAVVARLAGVIFFLGFNRDYFLLGLYDLIFFVPQAILLWFAVRTPVTTAAEQPPASPKVRWRLAAIGLAFLLIFGGITYYEFFRTLPPTYFASDEEHFLYGSIGTESTSGVPYWLWLVLPRVFPDKLPGPGGYASIGIMFAEGRELPVGFTKQTIGVDRVGINCAVCHASTYRKTPQDKPTIVPGGPGQTQSPQAYLQFLIDCASDPRFNSSVLMAEIAKNYHLSLLDSLTYRFVLIPFVKYTLLAQKNEYKSYGLLQTLQTAGRGRIDPFNVVKYRYLKQPPDGSLGNADMEPVWNLKAHTGSFHWDGLNNDIQEVLLSSAIGDGTPLSWVNTDWKKSDKESSLKRILNFISKAQPPKYPFPIDQALSAKGKAIYDQQCASCHAPGGARTGKVEPNTNPMLATDNNRIDMWTQNSATAYNEYTAKFSWKFTHFGKQNGYVNVTLDGLWLRGPYLHNGSVPSLLDLLRDPSERPKVFYRGYDVVDPENVGFISQGPEAQRVGQRFDTGDRGNGNGGHLWGTKLDATEKKELVEYLKTL